MKQSLSLIAALALLAAPAAAQDQMMAGDHTDPITSITKLQDQYLGWVIASAEMVTEANWNYRPTAEVRSFGELFGHVANANYLFCAGARGQESPSKVDFEKAGRAATIAGLKAAAAYCTETAEWGKAHHHDPVEFFGTKGDVTWVMAFNVAHNSEHYGNIVTYLRLKGMVPPSSQGG